MWQIQKKEANGAQVEKHHSEKGKNLFFDLSVTVNPAMSQAPGKHKFNIRVAFFFDFHDITNRGNLIIFIMNP